MSKFRMLSQFWSIRREANQPTPGIDNDDTIGFVSTTSNYWNIAALKLAEELDKPPSQRIAHSFEPPRPPSLKFEWSTLSTQDLNCLALEIADAQRGRASLPSDSKLADLTAT